MDYGAEYEQLMAENPVWFPGLSLEIYKLDLAQVIRKHGKPRRVLDYGSGRGYQYLALRLHEELRFPLPHCYDPAIKWLREEPKGKFGLILCTDVLEHIQKEDLDATMAHMLSFAADKAVVFLGISTRESGSKRLPDGRNVHLTVEDASWWNDFLSKHKRRGLTIVPRYKHL